MAEYQGMYNRHLERRRTTGCIEIKMLVAGYKPPDYGKDECDTQQSQTRDLIVQSVAAQTKSLGVHPRQDNLAACLELRRSEIQDGANMAAGLEQLRQEAQEKAGARRPEENFVSWRDAMHDDTYPTPKT